MIYIDSGVISKKIYSNYKQFILKTILIANNDDKDKIPI